MPTGTWKNADGLVVKFKGNFETGNPNDTANRLRTVNMPGLKKQAVMLVDLAKVGASTTWFPFDLTNDGTTRDGFSMEEPYLPSGSVITSAVFKTTEIAVGGTDVTIGMWTEAGVAIDADGIMTAVNGAIANMGAVGETILCTGALVQDATGEIAVTQDAWIAVTTNGTYTAGKGVLLIEYIDMTEYDA